MAEASNKYSLSSLKKARELKNKPREKWLLTRKTWRYMSNSGHKLVDDTKDGKEMSISALEEKFQEACNHETAFLLWEPRPFEGRKKKVDTSASSLSNVPGNDNSEDQSIKADEDNLPFSIFNTDSQSTSDSFLPIQSDHADNCLSIGTQTEESEFFETCWIKKDSSLSQISTASESAIVESQPKTDSALHPSATGGHFFSNAVMKYFGLGRKKTEKDKVDRFKTINYDRNLRNIKSKNVNLDNDVPLLGHSEEETTPQFDSSVGIQVGEPCVHHYYVKEPNTERRQTTEAFLPGQMKRPVDFTGTRMRHTVGSFQTPAASPVVHSRTRKTTRSAGAMIASAIPSPSSEVKISDASGWTSHSRSSISPNEEFGLPISCTDDYELTTLGFTESEIDIGCDFDSDFEYRNSGRSSVETNMTIEETSDVLQSPLMHEGQVFFGDNFKSASIKPSPKTNVLVLNSTYRSNERQSLPMLHTQSPIKIQERSTSTSAVPKELHLQTNEVQELSQCRSNVKFGTNSSGRRKHSQLSPTSLHVSGGLHLNSLISAVMHKSKSGGSLVGSTSLHTAANPKDNVGTTSHLGGHASRIMGKKMWKTRSKSQSRASASSTCIWTPQGSCKWTSITGRQVVLTDTTLLGLTEIERLTLQKVALAKLQALNLGVTIRPPAEPVSSGHKPKRRAHLLRKRALSGSGFFEGSKKESAAKDRCNIGGLVFGIPLDQCLANERAAKLRVAGNNGTTSENNEEYQTSGMVRKASHGSRTSFGSLIEGLKPDKGGSCESLNMERKRSSSLSCSSADGLSEETSLNSPCVPGIVTACFNHLEAYGLNTLGIFRVSSSKKRVRQLREDFDSGKEIQLNEENCPHDVATLLKEFFRDLPDPLLTRELYPAFVQTQKVRNRRLQMEALQHLIQLLPTSNRDTLQGLLSFLANVADKSGDHKATSGEMIPGNKMDSNNLATLFAPNILHMVKPGTSSEKMAAETAARAEERIDVINVIRCMIDHYKDIFEVPAELLDEVYVHLMDTHPEALDRLLRRRCQNNESHEDLDTSSSVFEGSECSSVPRTPTLDDLQLQQYIGSPESSHSNPSTRKWSQSESIAGNSQETYSHRHYRKREDILHENGGTGGRRGAACRERQIAERHRVVETVRSNADPSLANASPCKRQLGSGLKRADSADSQTRISITENPITSSPVAPIRPLLSRERSEPTIERRIVVQPVVHSSQNVPRPIQPSRSSSDHSLTDSELLGRRLSSPLVDNTGVITASLKISVATGPAVGVANSTNTVGKKSSLVMGNSFTVENENDIPYIEDTSSSQDDSSVPLRRKERSFIEGRQRPSVSSLKSEPKSDRKSGEISSRQRSGSSESYLGQPLTGSMQVSTAKAPQGNTGREQNKSASHDSVLSAASFISSPLIPLTPSSSSSNTSSTHSAIRNDATTGLGSGTSSPLSYGYHSPTPGTPPLSPTTPKEAFSAEQKEHVSESRKGLEKNNEKQIKNAGKETKGATAVMTGVVRSKTVDLERMMGVGRSSRSSHVKEEWIKRDQVKPTSDKCHEDTAFKKKVKKKYTGSRNQTDYLPDVVARIPSDKLTSDSTTNRGKMTAVLRKRWEIIASNPGGPETFV